MNYQAFENDTNLLSTDDTSSENSENFSKCLYMAVKIANLEVSALIDTGSSVNVMSQQFFNTIPDSYKSKFNASMDKITLANNQSIQIYGISDVKITVPQGKHWIHVYILAQTSHPLILGTNYLFSKKIVLDFSQQTVHSKTFKVSTSKPVSIPSNTEMLIWGKINGNAHYGMQGICYSRNIEKYGLLMAKVVVTVNRDKLVPIKIFEFYK